MPNEQSKYLSYLLRLWRENDDEKPHHCTGEAVWRASLENALTGRRHGFHCLNELFTFLRRETGVVVDGAEQGDDA
jgi:hypothetical protein